MRKQIDSFVAHVTKESANPRFIHHKWFVEYHLKIVEKIAFELCDIHEEADRDFVQLLVWLHDYGKILDFDNQYEVTLTAGKEQLNKLGFDEKVVEKAINSIEVIDRKDWEELNLADIEIKIVSSADAASHHTGPFMSLWWYENASKDYRELMKDNIMKSDKDWVRKMVLPEAREAFELRRNIIRELNGELPEHYLK